MLRLLPALVWFLFALSAPASAAQEFSPVPRDEPARGEPRIFTLNQDREASQLAQRLAGHLKAGRYDRAFDELEHLLSDHGGDVLPLEFSVDTPGDRPSLQPRHLGAAAWAAAAVGQLPPAALEAYETRFGEAAMAALEVALQRGSTQELGRIETRWPASRAALEATLALGDLELGRGHRGNADIWWQRCQRLAEWRADSPTIEALARRRAALNGLPPASRPVAGLRLNGAGERTGELPSGSIERWRTPLPVGPFNGLGARADYYNVLPVIYRERVYATTTLELLCLDAFTGQVLWNSGEPAGWERMGRAGRNDFFRGVDYEGLLAAPAAAQGVVVAALQIPFSIHDNEDIEGLTIMRRLPQRRLFAFDAATGARLWSHECPPDWDGGPLPAFEQEMTVAGPPAIADGLVLVPCVRMEGRVKLHVAAYDLWSGRLVWQAQVVTGQRELNMFNRHEREYSSPPVRIEGERVLVVTQLGTIAALDLFSGRVLWQALYDQIPLPGTHGYLTAERRRVWRNAPAVVADGILLATPIDSEDLVGVELATGKTRLSISNDLLRPRIAGSYYVDSLLGADRERVWLGGTYLVGWRRPGGLASNSRPVLAEPQERYELDELHPGSASVEGPRMLYTGQRLLVASIDGLDVYDPSDGQLRAEEGLSLTPNDVGNLALGDGILVTASGGFLAGFLDPSVIERRTRERQMASPADPGAALALARLLEQRARERTQSTPLAALTLLEELRGVLAPVEGRSEVNQELARGRLLEAQLREGLGEFEAAVDLYGQAADLSADLRQRLEALLALEQTLRPRDVAAWERLLGRLAIECGRLSMPVGHLDEPRWSEFSADMRLDVEGGDLRVAAWVEVQLALQRERESSFEAAILAWQTLVDGRAVVGAALAEQASARIGRLLEALGQELYAPLEQRAALGLQALAEQPAEGGAARGAALDELIRRYPFSRSADSARRLRLDWALESDDTAGLAKSVQGLLPRLADDGVVDPLATQLLVDLAIGLGKAGNTSFERAAIAQAARDLPGATCQRAPYEGWRLPDLARALDQATPANRPASAFDQTVSLAAIFPGQHSVLGSLTLAGEFVRFLWRQGRVEAYGENSPSEARFSRPLGFESRIREGSNQFVLGPTATGGRLVFASDQAVIAWDAVSGSLAWTFAIEDSAGAPSLALEAGVVLALERRAQLPQRLHALDLASGAPLWSQVLPGDGNWIGPTAGGEHVVVFDRPFASPARALVANLFTGRLKSPLELPVSLPPQLPEHCFVQGDLLVVPHFADGFVALFDLPSGRQLMRVEAGTGCDLHSLVRVGEQTFLVGLPSSFSESDRGGRIAELDLASGRLRDIERLASSDVPIGLTRGTTVQLEQPWLFVASNAPGARRTPVLALDLVRGKRWSAALPVGHATLYDADWSLPAVGANAAALIYGVRDESSLRRRFVRLEFYELETGRKLDSRMLSDDFAEARSINLLEFGDHLWISSNTPSGRQDRVDLLERPKQPR